MSLRMFALVSYEFITNVWTNARILQQNRMKLRKNELIRIHKSPSEFGHEQLIYKTNQSQFF